MLDRSISRITRLLVCAVTFSCAPISNAVELSVISKGAVVTYFSPLQQYTTAVLFNAPAPKPIYGDFMGGGASGDK